MKMQEITFSKSRIFLLCNKIFFLSFFSVIFFEWNLYVFIPLVLGCACIFFGSSSRLTILLFYEIRLSFRHVLGTCVYLYMFASRCYFFFHSVNFSTGQQKIVPSVFVAVLQYAYTHMSYKIGVKCVCIAGKWNAYHLSGSCLPDRCLKVIKLY